MKLLASEVIDQGVLTLQSDQKNHPYMIRVLDMRDLSKVMHFQEDMLARMENKELCVPIPVKELEALLNGNGETLGLFIQRKLLAVCSLLYNVSFENNMARELNFSSEELQFVTQLELAYVHKDLRGLKLQQKLAGALAWRATKRKESRYLFTTVSPYNYASIQTVTALGMQIAKLSKMYYGWDRYVAYKEFHCETRLDTANPVCLPNTAFAEQRELLNSGYRGYSQFRDKDGIQILFARMI